MHSADAQMLVLTVLADGPRHGYAINTAIEELTGRKLGPGSLYGALSRLEARKLARPTRRARPPAPHDADHRRGPRRAARRTGADGPASARPACARSGPRWHEALRAHGLALPARRPRTMGRGDQQPGVRIGNPFLARRAPGGRAAVAAPGRLARNHRRPDPPGARRRAVRRHRRRRAAGPRRRHPPSPPASAIRPRACGSPRSCSAPPSPPRPRHCALAGAPRAGHRGGTHPLRPRHRGRRHDHDGTRRVPATPSGTPASA